MEQRALAPACFCQSLAVVSPVGFQGARSGPSGDRTAGAAACPARVAAYIGACSAIRRCCAPARPCCCVVRLDVFGRLHPSRALSSSRATRCAVLPACLSAFSCRHGAHAFDRRPGHAGERIQLWVRADRLQRRPGCPRDGPARARPAIALPPARSSAADLGLERCTARLGVAAFRFVLRCRSIRSLAFGAAARVGPHCHLLLRAGWKVREDNYHTLRMMLSLNRVTLTEIALGRISRFLNRSDRQYLFWISRFRGDGWLAVLAAAAMRSAGCSGNRSADPRIGSAAAYLGSAPIASVPGSAALARRWP